jgi:imidazolonepropionase-like amidohydrolase
MELTCRQVLEFATIEGARACGMDGKIGSLTPGKRADIIRAHRHLEHDAAQQSHRPVCL